MAAKPEARLFLGTTSHSRFLPAPSGHSFSYPAIYVGTWLDELESGAYDVGRRFRYGGERWAALGFSARHFGSEEEREGLRPTEKVQRHLVDVLGYPRSARELKLYTVAIPAYLGFEGINPLIIHYVHEEDDVSGELEWTATVLEVHNTFGERHSYLLRNGVDEDAKVLKGYTRQFTFPRAFHVSPFNDRSGFYRVSLAAPTSLRVRVTLLTSSHSVKFSASLSCSPSNALPLDGPNVLRALARYPLDLALTMPRITYQAAKLHYGRKLEVFPKPEPFAAELGGAPLANRVGVKAKDGQVGGRPATAFEAWSRDRLAAFLFSQELARDQKKQAEISLVVRSTIDSHVLLSSSPGSSSSAATLQLSTTTPQLFSDLYTYPSPSIALSIATREKRWTVSSSSLFLALFATPPLSAAAVSTRRWNLAPALQRLRLFQARWELAFHPSSLSIPPFPSLHPLDNHLSTTQQLRLLLELAWAAFALRATYWVFKAVGAKYVEGTEPWCAHWLAFTPCDVEPEEDVGTVMRS